MGRVSIWGLCRIRVMMEQWLCVNNIGINCQIGVLLSIVLVPWFSNRIAGTCRYQILEISLITGLSSYMNDPRIDIVTDTRLS